MKIFKNLLTFFLIIILLSCVRTKYGHYKINELYISQNLSSDNVATDSNTYTYDSIIFSIYHYVYENIMVYNDQSSIEQELYLILIDYYNSINIYTINDYNSDHPAGSNINDILFVKYYDYIYNTMDYGYNFNNCPEFYNCGEKDFADVNQFIKNIDIPRANPFDLLLTAPPDTIVAFQLKAEIRLLDERRFILYSDSVWIRP